MRVSSLIILLAIVGGIGYVAIFQRQWVLNMFEQGTRLASGYAPAKTPAEAMDMFAKAIKAREYKTAADLYCTGPYAEQLAKMHEPAQNIGELVDLLQNRMSNLGYDTPKVFTLLYRIDAFPKNFHVKSASQAEGDKSTGIFEVEPNTKYDITTLANQQKNIDFNMLTNCLVNPVMFTGVEIVNVDNGKGEKSWKLNFPLPQQQFEFITYYNDHYKAYQSGLSTLNGELRNERFGSKMDAENAVFDVFVANK